MATEATAKKCQVLIIGAGPGGYLAAIRLGQLKKDTIIVEKESSLGGICLNVGCIPSKALIHAADFVSEAQHASKMGVYINDISVKMNELIQWKNQIVKKLTDGVKFLVEKNGSRIVFGTAELVSSGKAKVIAPDGGQIDIDFENAVLATGSSPLDLRNFPFDNKQVIDSTAALSLEKIPQRLVVIGASYIGLELGMVYRKLGSEVTFVEMSPKLLAMLDDEVGEAITRRLKEQGASLFLSHTAQSFEPGDPATVTIKDPQGNEKKLQADKVLVSVGRRPNTTGLGLEKAGVKLDKKGFIKVNDRLETGVTGIYAIGDVIGGPLLAHKAYHEAKIVAEIIAGEPALTDNIVIPAVIYTDPEIAWAGLSEKEAKAKGLEVTTGTFPFRASGRALTLNAPEGFVKTIAEAKTGLIKGMIMVGRDVSELISEASFALEMGAFLEDLDATIHPHPTLSEALVESVDAALGQAIHIVNKQRTQPPAVS
jgi:dihydrolipoamide dehydrogenase